MALDNYGNSAAISVSLEQLSQLAQLLDMPNIIYNCNEHNLVIDTAELVSTLNDDACADHLVQQFDSICDGVTTIREIESNKVNLLQVSLG